MFQRYFFVLGISVMATIVAVLFVIFSANVTRFLVDSLGPEMLIGMFFFVLFTPLFFIIASQRGFFKKEV